MISHKDRESGSEALEIALSGKNLRLAESVFDFIRVDLDTNPDKYSVKQRRFWLWSELKQELQEYQIVEYFQKWEDLCGYVEAGILYIK